MRFAFVLILCLLTNYLSAKDYPKREMRAVWIATVENIDWPSTPFLSTEAQKEEMIALLDAAKAYHMNAVVFQIRPDADALYASNLEPWSEWLTGKQGQAPSPYYDPLQFTIDACRKRGLDIHVWLNPYRAIQNTDKTVADKSHVTNTHPEWILTYGKKKYFDPGIPEARDHVARVVSDIVRRYDIDAIHFDDYFYPYKITGIDFPDSKSFKKYQGDFSADQLEDWRRNNVDLIIKQLHDSIQSINPSVEFGISPFGVWRNKTNDHDGSDTKAGVTNYDDLYADILKWQKEKWIDYVTPQLYWYIGKKVADYAILAKWWSENSYGCNVYTGQAPYLIDPKSRDEAWRTSDEITKQIALNRVTPNIKGSMFFSAKFLKANPLSVKEKLQQEFYRYHALTPENSLVKRITPAVPTSPVLKKEGKNVILEWQKAKDNTLFVVYQYKFLQRRKTDKPDKILIVTSGTSIRLNSVPGYKPARYRYAVTSVSPTHTESAPVYFKKN